MDPTDANSCRSPGQKFSGLQSPNVGLEHIADGKRIQAYHIPKSAHLGSLVAVLDGEIDTTPLTDVNFKQSTPSSMKQAV